MLSLQIIQPRVKRLTDSFYGHFWIIYKIELSLDNNVSVPSVNKLNTH